MERSAATAGAEAERASLAEALQKAHASFEELRQELGAKERALATLEEAAAARDDELAWVSQAQEETETALQSLSASTGAGAHGAKSASTSVAPRIRGALESRGTGHLSDQSILNHHFKGRWRQLPYGYNVGHKVHAVNRKLWGQIELASIHFVGRPKPWEVEPGSYRPGRGAPDATLTRRWHDSCGGEAAAPVGAMWVLRL